MHRIHERWVPPVLHPLHEYNKVPRLLVPRESRKSIQYKEDLIKCLIPNLIIRYVSVTPLYDKQNCNTERKRKCLNWRTKIYSFKTWNPKTGVSVAPLGNRHCPQDFWNCTVLYCFFAGMTYQDDTWDWIVSHDCARNKTVQIEYVLSTLKFSDLFHLFHKLSL